jgi:hypothetical protein
MKRSLSALAIWAMTVSSAPVPVPVPAPGPTPAPAAPPARVQPFAPQLSDLPTISGPGGWAVLDDEQAWAGLIRATPANRQAARWAYARSQIGQGRAAEALGALEVMRQDEPDLPLSPSYQLALGATLALLHRPPAAVVALSGEALADNPEACVWRMLALTQAAMAAEALAQFHCALPAMNARGGAARTRFLLPIARSAEALGKPAVMLQLLETLPQADPQANLLRGRAQLALGHLPEGKLLLARAARSPDREIVLDSELSALEGSVAAGTIPANAVARLRQIRFIWRGGDIERRALTLSYELARRTHDLRSTLDAGAMLFRYFDGGVARPTLIAELQETITTALAPGNPMPVDQVAGLYWDYRDLAPVGAGGDLLVSQLADRLQAAGLYERAGELLEHQLLVRTRDIAQGPLSARVASLFILAGRPARALEAIRATETNPYPDSMLWDRHRVEAVALDQLGRTNEAMAVLQEVPDGAAIRGELYWKRHDWKALAEVTEPTLSGAEPMTEVIQAKVLRYAIALAMLGREDALARLNAQYGAAFRKLPTAATFAALTAAVGAIDPATVSAAMAAIPAASPAGDIADLVDAAPAPNGPAPG